MKEGRDSELNSADRGQYPADRVTTHGGHEFVIERGPVHYAIEPVKIKPRSKRGQRKRTWGHG